MGDQDGWIPGWEDPLATIDRLCNIIVVNTGVPLGYCRLIESQDEFATLFSTAEMYRYDQTTEFLTENRAVVLDPDTRNLIAKSWQAVSPVWAQKQHRSRVGTALTYFYYAWRSPYVDQYCINLGVFFEVLFAPSSHGELSHQIAVNAARFLNEEVDDELLSTYQFMKRFYGVRSALVHGGLPDEGKVIDIGVPAFALASAAMKKILTEGYVPVFECKETRHKLLQSFVLGEPASE